MKKNHYDDSMITTVFGDSGLIFFPTMNVLIPLLNGYLYRFMDLDDYEQLLLGDQIEANRVYWIELLGRAHLTSVTSLFRLNHWACAILDAYERENFLSFSSAFRGFLESSADTVHALIHVPLNLAKSLAPVRLILKRNSDSELLWAPELEELLIHYSHARGRSSLKRQEEEFGVQFPTAHIAKTTRKYIDYFDLSRVHDCYSELCDITHPALTSVWMFMGVVDNDTYVSIDNLDMELIEEFCSKYTEVTEKLLQMPSNSALITMRVLNEFQLETLTTPAVNKIDFADIKLWQNIEDLILQPD
jgi:hypothetical protein